MAKRSHGRNRVDASVVDHRVMKQLVRMVNGSYEESGLDPETFMLVRIAALAAMDAAPVSWMANLKLGAELEIPPENAVGTLTAIAPVIGTAKTVAAAGNILKAVGLAEGLSEVAKKSKSSYSHAHQ